MAPVLRKRKASQSTPHGAAKQQSKKADTKELDTQGAVEDEAESPSNDKNLEVAEDALSQPSQSTTAKEASPTATDEADETSLKSILKKGEKQEPKSAAKVRFQVQTQAPLKIRKATEEAGESSSTGAQSLIESSPGEDDEFTPETGVKYLQDKIDEDRNERPENVFEKFDNMLLVSTDTTDMADTDQDGKSHESALNELQTICSDESKDDILQRCVKSINIIQQLAISRGKKRESQIFDIEHHQQGLALSSEGLIGLPQSGEWDRVVTNPRIPKLRRDMLTEVDELKKEVEALENVKATLVDEFGLEWDEHMLATNVAKGKKPVPLDPAEKNDMDETE